MTVIDLKVNQWSDMTVTTECKSEAMTVIVNEGGVKRKLPGGVKMRHHIISLEMVLIRAAWSQGMDVEDVADGFGEGAGTNDDWSGIRDSSDEAKMIMLGRAMNFFEIMD